MMADNIGRLLYLGASGLLVLIALASFFGQENSFASYYHAYQLQENEETNWKQNRTDDTAVNHLDEAFAMSGDSDTQCGLLFQGRELEALVIGHITDRVKSDFYDGNLWKGLDDSNVYEIHLDGIRLDGVNGKSRLEAVQDFDVYSVSVDHETMVIRMTLE